MFENNKKVSEHLRKIARLHEAEREPYKARAFIKAANSVESFGEDIATVDPIFLPHVGPSTYNVIVEVLQTGTSKRLQELEKENPDLVDLQRLPGVGPVKAKVIFKDYGVTTLKELRIRVDKGDVLDEELIRKLERTEKAFEYIPRPWAELEGNKMIELLRPYVEGDYISFAGSIRRKKDYVRDIDILLVPKVDVLDIYAMIVAAGYKVEYGGGQKIRIEYEVAGQPRGGDIVITSVKEWPFAINYLTGSKEFNIAIRGRFKNLGWTINEHRLARIDDDFELVLNDEEDLFHVLKIPYVPPECRQSFEDVGRDFSRLLSRKPQGEFHCHTSWSDGMFGVEQRVDRAFSKALFRWIGVADHTAALPGGVNAEKFMMYVLDISATAVKWKNLPMVLAGIELDIDAEGNPYFPYDLLKQLDFVIISIHHRIGENMVARYSKAIKALPGIPKILGHLTGRLFPSRSIPDDSWDKLFTLCYQTNTLIEINGQPDRLDPPAPLIQMASQMGCRFVLATDAHGDVDASILENAWWQARTGKLTDSDLLCTSTEVDQWIRDAKAKV